MSTYILTCKTTPNSIKNHIFVMLRNYGAASKQLVEKVISTMSNDEIGNAAKSEDLITKLGNLWLIKSYKNKLH